MHTYSNRMACTIVWPGLTFFGLANIIRIQYILHCFDLYTVHLILFVHLFLFNFHGWNERATELIVVIAFSFPLYSFFHLFFFKYAQRARYILIAHDIICIYAYALCICMIYENISFVRSACISVRIFVALTSFDNRITFRHKFLLGFEIWVFFLRMNFIWRFQFCFIIKCHPKLSSIIIWVSVVCIEFEWRISWCKLSQFAVISKVKKTINSISRMIECDSLFQPLSDSFSQLSELCPSNWSNYFSSSLFCHHPDMGLSQKTPQFASLRRK